MTQTTVRFAPSPTGRIHIGNARTALFNWLFATRFDGTFVLRLDDTDAERSTEEFANGIVEDLSWLGIEPDRIERQSARREAHEAAAERLKASGLLYPCYETPDELERQRQRRQARRLPPVYDRSALRMTGDDLSSAKLEGRLPHWRFLLPNFDGDPFVPRRTLRQWTDLTRGPQTVDLAAMSDPVLIREDGTFLYTLPSVVDDIELGVSAVIRGDDHVTNTGAQLALFEALGASIPTFGHHNLLTTVDGEGLSKRSGALSLKTLREDGIEPMAVASLATLLGTSGQVVAAPDIASLRERFHLDDASKSAARFDPAELLRLNAELVHEMPYGAAAERLAELGIEGPDAEPFWNVVRANCEKVRDAAGWWAIVRDAPARDAVPADDREFVREAFDLLPETIDETTWSEWTGRLKAQTGRRGRALFMPLRLALTGLDHGPELGDLLPLIGRERILARRP